MAAKKKVDNSIYEQYGERWYSAHDDPVALLRAETKAKLPWVLARIDRHFGRREIELLDVGCGGGFLSNPLAMAGMRVTGVDLSRDSLRTAQRHDHSRRVRYFLGDAYHLPFRSSSFEAVAAMDLLEHVEDPLAVIRECARVLKPGGIFFFHTFNRNWLSGFLVIKCVEWLVRNTPKHLHVLRLFVTPEEMDSYCRTCRLEPREMVGLRPNWRSVSWRDILRRTVPESMSFTTTNSLRLSYMGWCVKAPLNASSIRG
jgi:2-polyprenyl-6-hydroxyphenyl methylase/3-demethylubiquinone-9 3-methyltransferase